MHKLSFLVFVGTLALSLGGCNPGGGGETASSPSPNNTPAAQTPAKQDFPGAVVPGKPGTDAAKQPSTTAVLPAPPSDLIPSTDPKARLGGLQKGVTDPFAQPPIQIEENKPQVVTPNNGNQKPVPNVRRIPGTESTPGVKVPTSLGQRGTAQVGRRQTTPRLVAPSRPRIPPAVEVGTPNRPKAPEPFALQPPSRLRVRPLNKPVEAPNRPKTGESFTLKPSRGFVARNRTSTPSRFVVQPSRRNVPRTTVAVQPRRRATSSQIAARTPSRNPIVRARAIARTLPQTSTARRTAVARATQSTPVRRTAAIARAPQRARNTAIARAPQRARNTAIARAPQRQPARTTAIARAPQRQPARTTAAARPTTPSRTTAVNVTPSPAATTPASPTPAVSPTPTAPVEPQIPALPPPPEPTLARAVEVSGVVQIGNEPQAIIKAPNEATSRYVKVGQRLSQGQVLVKRIEMNDGSEPVVVLEENGIEVAKMVGDRPAAPAQPGSQPATPAAAVTILFAAGGMAIARSLSRQTSV